MNTSLISKDTLYNCSNKQEIDIRFLFIPGTKSTLSNIMNLSQKNNFKFPTDLAETTSPVPSLSVISPSASILQELVS